jgi:hypothetical protein
MRLPCVSVTLVMFIFQQCNLIRYHWIELACPSCAVSLSKVVIMFNGHFVLFNTSFDCYWITWNIDSGRTIWSSDLRGNTNWIQYNSIRLKLNPGPRIWPSESARMRCKSNKIWRTIFSGSGLSQIPIGFYRSFQDPIRSDGGELHLAS